MSLKESNKNRKKRIEMEELNNYHNNLKIDYTMIVVMAVVFTTILTVLL